MRYLRLTEEEKNELELLHKNSPNSLVRERSMMILLSNNSLCVNEIALFSGHTRHTVSRLLNAWKDRGSTPSIDILSIKKGRGVKVKLRPVAELLPELVEKHNRNLKPILAILEKEHHIKVSKQTLQNFLKGAGV
jgi:transposase